MKNPQVNKYSTQRTDDYYLLKHTNNLNSEKCGFSRINGTNHSTFEIIKYKGMKNIKIYSVLLLLLFAMSCSDFLEEESKLTKTEDLVYSDAAAVEGLVAACYSYTRMWYGHEMAIYLAEGGTDLWYPGKDGKWSPAGELTTYNGLKADMGVYDQMWEVLYYAINTCNTAEDVLMNKGLLDEEETTKRLSEVRFMRAFYYWHMVEQWGPLQLNLEPTKNPSTLFTRNSEEEIYMQMFKDVQFAIDNLDPEDVDEGFSRVTWLAAKAFKARLALYWGSAYHAGGADYLATAAQEAKDVIAAAGGLGKSLYDNYAEVWDQTKNSATDNAEFIWSIDYYDDIGAEIRWSDVPIRLTGSGDWHKTYTRADGFGQGNTMHLFWAPLWNNQSTSTGGPGITDVLTRVSGNANFYTVGSPAEKVNVNVDQFYVKYSMGYTRMGPTRYCLDLFDETIDERWDATFRSAWYKHPGVIPKYWPTDSCAYPLMSHGTDTDTVLFFSKRPLTQAQIDWAAGRYKVIDVTTQFEGENGDIPTPGTVDGGAVMYNYLRKWENLQSTLGDLSTFNDYFSNRDFPVFRLAEMYLIAAEALAASDQAQAIDILNVLREKRAIDGKEAEFRVTSVDIDLILEERAREFTTELHRWFDLKRTKKLEQQVQNNPTARDFFEPSKHYLRPIPTIQISSSSNSSDPTLQNPGYN